MNRNALIAVVAVVGFWWYTHQNATPPAPGPAPVPCPGPGPCPPTPPPAPPRKPWGPSSRSPVGDTIGGGELNGVQIACDLPASEHLKNKGGSDGAGLCVFTSIDHASRWQGVSATTGFRDYMTKFPGGGYPAKVDEYVKKICAEKSLPVPPYVQITNGDISVLDKAIASGRMVCVTYGYSPRYGQNISHMVNLVHLDATNATILDNNFPGDTNYEWITRDEFKKRWLMQSGGWAFILCDGPPPPIPTNK